MSKKHKIIELRSANVKRLRAIEIEPNGNMVVIGGRNAQGKSSVLDSIVVALGGSKNIPDNFVRDGEEKAEIVLRTDTGLLVRRVIKADGKTQLEIRQIDEDGMEHKVTSPQALLDKLVGKIAFDPLAFTRLRPQEQVNLLRQVVGVDTTEIDVNIQEAFESRTEASRRLRDAEGVLKQMPKYEGVPEEEVSAADLTSRMLEIAEENAKRQRAGQDVADAKSQCSKLEAEIASATQSLGELESEGKAELQRLQDEIARLQEQVEQTKLRFRNKYISGRNGIAAKKNDLSAAQAKVKELEASVVTELLPDGDIADQIAEVDQTNRKVRENQARAKMEQNVGVLRKHVDELTERIEAERQKKVEVMEQAEWPIDGLGFTENGVTFNGRAFELLSSAEQLRVSAAIGLSQNPGLPILLIRDGSLLDEDSLRDVAEIAAKYNGQVWVERVSTGLECSVVIEDGAIVSQPAGA